MSAENKKTQDDEGFFKKIFSSLFGSTDPEAIKKKKLKNIAKLVSKGRYKFYKVSTSELQPQFAQFIYEIYKLVGPLQIMLSNAQISEVLKSITIDSCLSTKQVELVQKLSPEYIYKCTENQQLKNIAKDVKDNLTAFAKEFSSENVANVEKVYSSLMIMSAFVSFDYYFLLKKFDAAIPEHNFDYKPHFVPIHSEYVINEVKDFVSIAWPLSVNDNWPAVMAIFKTYKGIEPIGITQWNKMVQKVQDLRDSQMLDMIIQLMSHDPLYVTKIYVKKEKLIVPYVDNIRNQAEETLKKIEKENFTQKLDQLLHQLFGSDVPSKLKYYNDDNNAAFQKKGVAGFKYHQPMSYMKAFLLDYFKKDIRTLSDLLLVRGKWITQNLSVSMSTAYHELLSSSDKIKEFDESLGDDSEYGARFRSLLNRLERERDASRMLKSFLKEVNDQALLILTEASENLIVYAKNLKHLMEDKDKATPQLLTNWNDLEHASDKPIKEFIIEVYKKIFLVISLMQIFIGENTNPPS